MEEERSEVNEQHCSARREKADSAMDNLLKYLGASPLGIFGAGHLGRAVAYGLLAAGFPRRQLAIGHRGLAETAQRLWRRVYPTACWIAPRWCASSKILLYSVRPQDYRAIAECSLREDALFISFLAGVPLLRLPLPLAACQRVRVMPGAPDTIRQRTGIAALYPAGSPIVCDLLAALSLRIFPLQHEEDLHAFTAFGPCLPIALTYWEGLSHRLDDDELLDMAAQYGLCDFPAMLAWARTSQPQHLSPAEHDRYVRQAATPGGVTEAILQAIDEGQRLSAALERGIQRSRALGVV